MPGSLVCEEKGVGLDCSGPALGNGSVLQSPFVISGTITRQIVIGSLLYILHFIFKLITRLLRASKHFEVEVYLSIYSCWNAERFSEVRPSGDAS